MSLTRETQQPAGALSARFFVQPGAPRLDETSRQIVQLLPGGHLAWLTHALAAAPAPRLRAPIPYVERVAPAPSMPESIGALAIPDRATFERLSSRADVPGASKVLSLKFLMMDVDTDAPTLYLINSRNFSYHYFFYVRGLGGQLGLEEFNAQTFFTNHRKNVAGVVVLHDSFVGSAGEGGPAVEGLYALEFWPTDPVKAPMVARVFAAMRDALPFAAAQLAYHPAGNTQEALLAEEAALLAQLGVRTITSRELFANVTYSAMNLGEGVGLLRVFASGQAPARPPTVRDIALFQGTPPNELSHVAGIITDAPQTPLSHVNLKAQQNHTPNAYIKDAASDPRIAPFIGQIVRFVVGPEGFELRPATAAEADAFLETIRPPTPQAPPRDLSERSIRRLDEVSFGQALVFGAKATNVAELGRVLPRGVVPDGYAVPFSFYDEFMQQNGLYEAARALLGDPRFQEDAAVREERLRELRKQIRAAAMPPQLAAALEQIQQALLARHGAAIGIRCRSSTNNEDLPGFNGAGLYDSYTHRPDEGKLDKTIRQVYASLWNFRAFEEREFYRVDHFQAAMGVLVHPNEDDERANGVAYTKNIVDPSWPGFYVNAQVGEQLVTNPTGNATPDEFLISRIGAHGEYETQYIAHSNLTADGRPVLTEAQIAELVEAMEVVHARFKVLYRREDDPGFAMDIEFKIRKDGSLQIKQARPVVA